MAALTRFWQAVEQNRARPIEHSVPRVPTLADHERLLSNTGFAEVGTVWQHGDDWVLVAIR